MDAQRFDALTRSFHTSGTRRALSGLLATLLGLLALTRPGIALEAEAKKKNRRRKKVKAAGPCGDGGGKANRCKRNRHCCTGYCQQRKKKRKNGRRRKVQGRCRCRKEGQSCSEDHNCCPEQTGRICKGGACQVALCADLCPDGCCDGETCLAGDSDAACGTGGAPCQSCGAMQFCVEGTCQLCIEGSCQPGRTAGCQYATIQEAIDDPDGPTTIRLCAGTYEETITITRDLTILGQGDDEDGTILDGQQEGSVIIVNEGVTLTLEALRISGGGSVFQGGGVYNNGGNVTLTICTVTGNKAQYGGGIYSGGGAFLLNGCTIADNVAGQFGGGIYSDTGPGADTFDLIDCTVSNNTATGRLGGGIFNGLGVTATLSGTTVTGNSATQQGGGIFCDVNGTVNLTDNSTVSGNTPDNCAGPTSATFNGPGCAP